MIKAPIALQDLRRRTYVKAKAEPSWRFWGLYVHVCRTETLYEAYRLAKRNNGAPGIDGVTFEAIEAYGVERFVEQLRAELVNRTYRSLRVRKAEIPKDGDKVRVLSIPAIRDRVVQGALKLILEPIFEAGFQPGSFGYRPKRGAQDAIQCVSEAIIRGKTYVLDLDLKSFFDTVRHDIVLEKVARRVNDGDVMCLLRMIMKATGKQGVPQGGVISPLLSNVLLDEVDRLLERAKEVTHTGQWTAIEYARFADDLVVLVDSHPRHHWLRKAVERRIREELAKLRVEVNEKKTQPTRKLIETINPILRGWVNYFRTGHSSRCFSFVQDWVEKKIRRHLARARKRPGFGWKRWSRQWLYDELGLFGDYRIRRYVPRSKAAPAR